MGDAIQTRPLLVVRPHDVPGRKVGVGSAEHLVTSARVVKPAAAGRQVYWAELPSPQRILDARFETTFLLFVAHFQPEFDQQDAACGDVALEDRAQFEETAVLFLAAEVHHVLHTGAIVPATVEDNDFACGRKLLQVALHVHLGLFAVGRSRQRHHAENARADTLSNGLDRAAFAGAIPSFEHEDDAESLVFHPSLEFTELNLELVQLLFVFLVPHFLILGNVRFFLLFHKTRTSGLRRTHTSGGMDSGEQAEAVVYSRLAGALDKIYLPALVSCQTGGPETGAGLLDRGYRWLGGIAQSILDTEFVPLEAAHLMEWEDIYALDDAQGRCEACDRVNLDRIVAPIGH